MEQYDDERKEDVETVALVECVNYTKDMYDTKRTGLVQGKKGG